MAAMQRQPNHHYGTGRRKTAVARVYIKPGKGDITVNGKPVDVFFSREFKCSSFLQTAGTKMLALARNELYEPFLTMDFDIGLIGRNQVTPFRYFHELLFNVALWN